MDKSIKLGAQAFSIVPEDHKLIATLDQPPKGFHFTGDNQFSHVFRPLEIDEQIIASESILRYGFAEKEYGEVKVSF